MTDSPYDTHRNCYVCAHSDVCAAWFLVHGVMMNRHTATFVASPDDFGTLGAALSKPCQAFKEEEARDD